MGLNDEHVCNRTIKSVENLYDLCVGRVETAPDIFAV